MLNETVRMYVFWRQLQTRTLLKIWREHSRDSEDRKSFLALCYALRKRGYEMPTQG